MNQRIKPIIVPAHLCIKEAMQRMQEGPHANPPAPSGIVLVVDEKNKLLGVVTDGDMRRAILNDLSDREEVRMIMTKNPLCVQSNQTAQEMLSELYREIKKRGAPESKYHKIVVIDESGAAVDVVTPFELWRRSEVKTKTAAVIGLGYVGLTLALTLNELGIAVYGIDTNEEVVNKLHQGIPHFYEKGLDVLLKKHIGKNLFVKNKILPNASDIYIICVSTPIDARGKVVYSHIKDAAVSIGKILKAHDLVIMRSTVPIGTCRNLVIPILEQRSGLKVGEDFFVAFAPERTVEGKALEELRTLPQVIGGYNSQSLDYTAKVFQLFAHSIVPVSSLEEAEAVKLLNNTFRDVGFAFANEVAKVCSPFGLSAREIIRAANEGYPRDRIPYPSPGVGGVCLKKDPYLFLESAKRSFYKAQLPKFARSVNKGMVDFVASKVKDFLAQNKISPKEAKVFIMGVAFKGEPETSDIRDSASVDIISQLKNSKLNTFIYDPVASKHDMSGLGVNVVNRPSLGFRMAHCALVLNNHHSYRDLDIYTLAKSMKRPAFIFDGWGMYHKEQFAELTGITYVTL